MRWSGLIWRCCQANPDQLEPSTIKKGHTLKVSALTFYVKNTLHVVKNIPPQFMGFKTKIKPILS